MQGSRIFRFDDWSLSPKGLLGRSVELELDSAKNQFFYRASFTRSFAFELPIERIRNVDRRSHNQTLPYLWQIVKIPNRRENESRKHKPPAPLEG
jgi:hypothetical protein